jgi:hypothetical protein
MEVKPNPAKGPVPMLKMITTTVMITESFVRL